MSKQTVYLGIDVGKSGALVAIDDNNNIVFKAKVPQIKDKTDLPTLFSYFEDLNEKYNVVAVIEDVHSVFESSKKSNFVFGEIKGIKLGILISMRIPYAPVQPKEWQSFAWIPSDKVKKTGKSSIDTKATSLLAAKRLFPRENFLATERSSVPHDGIVDAALMALYCKNYFK